ncbi:PaaI family thioesterase [Inediibacterium massiliense]|uniref:PaaI family thioesterase n=1 Tax=Inediibacterium massiliense TaxID=1658111 RepID=UPI0006B3FC3C|nr:PaaI family thioesterase [Inediibacterium massiliense]
MKQEELKHIVENGILGDFSANCVQVMKPKFIEYIEDESLTCAYPILHEYLNPRNTMQGGFMAAAFDNTLGVLVHLSTGKVEFTSLDLSVHYHRPIFEKDELTVIAKIQHKGRRIVQVLGEGYNKEKKLIATASSKIMILEKEKFFKNK